MTLKWTATPTGLVAETVGGRYEIRNFSFSGRDVRIVLWRTPEKDSQIAEVTGTAYARNIAEDDWASRCGTLRMTCLYLCETGLIGCRQIQEMAGLDVAPVSFFDDFVILPDSRLRQVTLTMDDWKALSEMSAPRRRKLSFDVPVPAGNVVPFRASL